MIEYLVEFNEQLLVDCVQEVGHLNYFGVKNDTVASWDGDTKVL